MTCYQVAVGTLAAAGLDPPPPFFSSKYAIFRGWKLVSTLCLLQYNTLSPLPPPPSPPHPFFKNLARPLLDLLVMESCALTIGPMCVTWPASCCWKIIVSSCVITSHYLFPANCTLLKKYLVVSTDTWK